MKIRIIPGAILTFFGLWTAIDLTYAILKNDNIGIVGNAIMTVVLLTPGIILLYTGLRKEKTKT